ncbi:MAG: hypothetical protein N2C13_02460 [Chloroflexota bacterium]
MMSPISIKIIEMRQDQLGNTSIVFDCPTANLPNPGQYMQAYSQTAAYSDADSILPITLFPDQYSNSDKPGFTRISACGPLPSAWLPGKLLQIRTPLGHGFTMPDNLNRLILVSVTSSPSRLLPLIPHAKQIALFTDHPTLDLPEEVEISPLSELPPALSWPDFMAIDCPIENLHQLENLLPQELSQPPCPTQVLVHSQMPCSGLADCGVCALPAKRGYKLACKDGPVFEWRELNI